jgi:hypothetical protein
MRSHPGSDLGKLSKKQENDELVLNGKTISSETIENMVLMRFHSCLKREADANPNKANEMDDSELIKSTCRKERLTLFNYLNQQGVYHPEEAKKMINREYGVYFPRGD